MIYKSLWSNLLRITAIASVLSTCFCGCSSVKIQTKVDPTYEGTIKRVYIISGLSRITESFGIWSRDVLPSRLSETGLEIDVALLDPLELKPEDVFEKAKASNPDAVLVLMPTTMGGIALDKISMARVDASLYLSETGERIWRAALDISLPNRALPTQRKIFRQFMRKLVEGLRSDGLVQ